MGINGTVVRQPVGSWLFTWPVGTSPYSVYLDGVRLANGLTVESFEFVNTFEYFDEAPPLEILNAGDPVENLLFPPRFTLQWRGLQNATAYIVEQFLSGSFKEVANIMENATGYYKWKSNALADGDLHQFRVIAVDVQNNEGTPITFSSDIDRNPATPAVAFAITAGDVVVSAAP